MNKHDRIRQIITVTTSFVALFLFLSKLVRSYRDPRGFIDRSIKKSNLDRTLQESVKEVEDVAETRKIHSVEGAANEVSVQDCADNSQILNGRGR